VIVAINPARALVASILYASASGKPLASGAVDFGIIVDSEVVVVESI